MKRGAFHLSAARAAGRLVCAAAMAAAVLAASPLPASADTFSPQVTGRVWSPEVLDGNDRETYRKLFTAVERGRFADADKLAAQLRDKRLMGYVLHAKYLGPHYRTSYAELRDWLAKYNDQPGAADIYKLAMKRRPASAAAPMRPEPRRWRQPVHTTYAVDDGIIEATSQRFRDMDDEVRKMLRTESAVHAEAYLRRKNARNALNSAEFSKVRERIVASYFLEGEDERAYKLASEILSTHARDVPLADWYAGLASWRMGHYASAARHFESLSNSQRISPWTKAAGSFWAARAYLAEGKPEKVAPLLETAADTGATFYGILATRQLGRDLRIEWAEPRLDEASFRALIATPSVGRAVALTQTGRHDLAREELLRAHALIDPSLDQAMIALAIAYDLPAVQLQVANAAHLPATAAKGGRIALNAGLFPLADYKPSNGYKVDRALLLAFMRQESGFKPDAMSWAGARGLMQIMPATATHITQDRSLAGDNRDRLLDPTFNVTLGQEYIAELMGSGGPNDNLFMLTTAYNGGPGNLSRWLSSIDFRGDPFLFIESIPAAETRGYIERVVTNYWIYRERLGQPVGSLDATASGTWPVYDGIGR
ncbi:MAG: lytic transglycosylase domain-containing protein [Parvibaculum sp.]|nr:lytic transglycosylase domain-containing protein [Parvibaculum sp.]